MANIVKLPRIYDALDTTLKMARLSVLRVPLETIDITMKQPRISLKRIYNTTDVVYKFIHTTQSLNLATVDNVVGVKQCWPKRRR